MPRSLAPKRANWLALQRYAPDGAPAGAGSDLLLIDLQSGGVTSIGGALIAFVPNSPSWTLDPGLALALFVAPVLLDAAFDTSLRERDAEWGVRDIADVETLAESVGLKLDGSFEMPANNMILMFVRSYRVD